jgi:hypothetical protein
MTYVAGPIANFEAIRRDPTAHLIAALDKAGSLGERARGAVQVGRTRGTSDLPNLVRAGHGPGWALAGDAGLVMDPITGLGIGHALRDAELLSAAVLNGLGGTRNLPGALTRYEKQRNRETKPAFNWTLDVAALRGVNEIEEELFRTIGADEAETSQFFGMLTGAVPMRSFFSPAHLIRLIGRDFRRLARLVRVEHRDWRVNAGVGGLDLSGDCSGTGSESANRRADVEQCDEGYQGHGAAGDGRRVGEGRDCNLGGQ